MATRLLCRGVELHVDGDLQDLAGELETQMTGEERVVEQRVRGRAAVCEREHVFLDPAQADGFTRGGQRG